MTNLKIYLFRHGQSTFNRDGKFTGWMDARLTRKGKEQAKTIAKKLKNKKFQVAFRTSLSRSNETLKPVLKFHPECKKILVDDRMIERSYGIFEGTTHKDFIKKYGQKKYDLVHRGYNVKVPKGESFADVEKRVGSFIKWLKNYMIKNKINVAISAHGNSIRLFRKIMENATRDEATKWTIPYDKIFEYALHD